MLGGGGVSGARCVNSLGAATVIVVAAAVGGGGAEGLSLRRVGTWNVN